MCLAIPGVIKTLKIPFAYADIQGIETKVNVELIDGPMEGDCVLIHAGFAIQKIDREYLDYLDRLLKEIVEDEDNYESL